MYQLKSLTAAILLTLAGSGPASADIFAFIDMPLTGSQQSPAISTSGYGSFTGLYDSSSKVLVFNVTWQLQPNAVVNGSHFHGPASLGQNAGVLIPVTGLAASNSGRYGGSVTLSAAQESDLLAGKWYFNIHSNLAPNGEVRAQLIENSASAASARLSAASGMLSLPTVLVPEAGAYAAQLQFIAGSNPPQFTLTGASAIR
jgi:hypothetical protein